jgi:predicted phosphate transport protein (TIGR00153 family)
VASGGLYQTGGPAEGGRLRQAGRRWNAFGAKPPQAEMFVLLRSSGHNLANAATVLDELLRTWPDDRGLRGQISRLEEEGDRLTHKLVNQLRKSKLAPFDREDIHSLAGAIDDVVDDVEEVSEQLVIKHVEAPMEQAQQLAGVLRDSGRALSAALDGLETLEGVDVRLIEIRDLEREGDQLYRGALASLFDNAIDPMFVLRWKDIYGALEEGIDRCRTAANSIDSIVVKHS